MQVIISIVFFIAAHFVPSEAPQFVMGTPNGRDITWVRDDSGGWRMKKDTKNQVGTWSINGTSLVGEVQGRKHSNDMAEGLSISPNTDWKTVSKIMMGEEAFHIQNNESGLTITHHKPNAAGDDTETQYRITWALPKQ